MTMVYTAMQGDTVDYVAWKVFGSTSNRIVEQILEINIGLANVAILAAGTQITLPDQAPVTPKIGVKLWD